MLLCQEVTSFGEAVQFRSRGKPMTFKQEIYKVLKQVHPETGVRKRLVEPGNKGSVCLMGGEGVC